MLKFLLFSLVFFGLAIQVGLADGPQDNSVLNVRPVPPDGIELTTEQTEQLRSPLAELEQKIAELMNSKDKRVQQLLPDVQVYHRAVSQAVQHREMFDERDVRTAAELLTHGLERAHHLLEGRAPWTTQHGFVVRGFVSALDGTVQPYGLEIASDYNFDHPAPVRCDLWFHGRGEKTMELHFISQRSRVKGPFPPQTGIVLHPYGRYSNAFKFAGEVDVLEALAHVQQQYKVDPDRIAVRGFSMGGAGCWQFAVHVPDLFFAANPGAGFSETPQFLKSFQGESLDPPWYEEKLWRMYDCDLWANNLRHLPVVAYSGEMDRQKQAADVMEAALHDHNIALMHVIGPQTAHAIHPESNQIIRQKMSALASRGIQRFPRQIDFTTFTLKYNRLHWLTVHGLQEHWERSTINARLEGDSAVWIETAGITEFSIDFPAGASPFDLINDVSVVINGQMLPQEKTKTDLSFHAHYHFDGNQWRPGPSSPNSKYRKQHNLQGPIDDALMTPFLFVEPTETSTSSPVQEWVHAEKNRAVREWRRQMRGDVRIKNDTEVTEAEIEQYNLILWGTPQSNTVIARIQEELPIHWNENSILVGEQEFATTHHVPVLVHPNPLNPKRYVVLNSSLTYREYDYLNNARQTPKLPDWSILDITTPPNARWPGKIVHAGFFNENWELQNPPKQ